MTVVNSPHFCLLLSRPSLLLPLFFLVWKALSCYLSQTFSRNLTHRLHLSPSSLIPAASSGGESVWGSRRTHCAQGLCWSPHRGGPTLSALTLSAEPSGAMVLPTLQGQALLSPPSPASWSTHCFPYAPEASPHSPTLMEQVTELSPHSEHAQAHSLNSLT